MKLNSLEERVWKLLEVAEKTAEKLELINERVSRHTDRIEQLDKQQAMNRARLEAIAIQLEQLSQWPR